MAFTIDRSRSIISAMIYGRRVTAMDVAWLRREVFAEGPGSREAIDELFEVERAEIAKAPEWTDFFVEMVTEHVIRRSRPTGELDERHAEWLLDQADSCSSPNAFAAFGQRARRSAQRAPLVRRRGSRPRLSQLGRTGAPGLPGGGGGSELRTTGRRCERLRPLAHAARVSTA